MLRVFEQMVRDDPKRPFFHFIDEKGARHTFTYESTKTHAAGLALALKRRGVGYRSAVAIDIPNCPAFVFAALAAAYGGFSLVVLNNRLTSFEKEGRLRDLSLTSGISVDCTLTERSVATILETALDFANAPDVMMKSSDSGPLGSRNSLGWGKNKGRLNQRRANSRYIVDEESIAVANKDESAAIPLAFNEIIHFAERARAAFTRENRALIMFTSGTSGKPKAVPLTWENVCSSAEISNSYLNQQHEGCWQAVLPMFHIGGFEVMVRSVLNRSPFVLYRKFNADRILADAEYYRATHISVVDKMLQDFLTSNRRKTLTTYQCILLGGASFNTATLNRAMAAGARVYASYGMTETSSQVANTLVAPGFKGELSLLPYYEARVVNPDAQGFGQLALRGPGVFEGYLNSKTSRTIDGFFLTGDTAACDGSRIVVRERSADMFVSGGENIYPSEIQHALLRHPLVADAFVFGVDDAQWGKRPVAFIERMSTPEGMASTSAQSYGAQVLKDIEGTLSPLYRPKHLCVVDEFPRTGIGKLDRQALMQRYEQRIEIRRVSIYRISQPLVHPFVTAKGSMQLRESLIIEVEDWHGRKGLSECVAFPTDWYLPETLNQDLQILEQYLIPLVLSQVYFHPSEVSVCFDECRAAATFPLAKGALEPALWDVFGKIVQKPLWRLIGGTAKTQTPGQMRLESQARDQRELSSESLFVPGGVALGIMSIEDTLKVVQKYVAAGYRRVKLKIKPGDDVERVRAIRQAFPSVTLVLDANQSYTDQDFERLYALDIMGAHCIEEPLDPNGSGREDPVVMLKRLADLQQTMRTDICLDESLTLPKDYLRALDLPDLCSFTLKVAKMGGIQPTLAFYRYAYQVGIDMWMGGMYETSISKRMHAAFQTLPGIDVPGDLSETTRYFARDIARPALVVDEGAILLNAAGYEHGLGCELDYRAIDQVLIEKRTYPRR